MPAHDQKDWLCRIYAAVLKEKRSVKLIGKGINNIFHLSIGWPENTNYRNEVYILSPGPQGIYRRW